MNVALSLRTSPQFVKDWLCSEVVSGCQRFDQIVYIWSGHMTDVDIVSHGPVEEPVQDRQTLQTPGSHEEDEDEDDTDTDDGAVGEDEDTDGSLNILTIINTLIYT